MSREQELIDRIHWYHEFNFGNGLRAGYWSFYAERRGAAGVLATDDRSQNWTGSAGLHLAKELLQSSVEHDLELSVYDLSRLDEKFDIILYLGVFYHLIDPFLAFAQIRHRCHNTSIVVFEGDVFLGLTNSPDQSAALYGRDVRRAPRFVPEPDTLRFFLNAAYFNIATESMLPLSNQTKEGFPKSGVNRMLLICKPFRGFNSCHEYQPPFGLSQYDNRSILPPNQWSDLYMGG